MRKRPSLEQTTRLVARALATTPDQLKAGFQLARPEDVPRIVALRRDALGALIAWDDDAYLRWRYGLGKIARSRACELWKLEIDGKLIGIIGRQVTESLYRGKPLRTTWGMDVLIDPAYNASGVGVWLTLVHQDDADLALAVGANDNSVGTIQRLYEALPSRKSYTLPIDFRALTSRLNLPGWLAWLCGSGLNMIEPAVHWWHRPRRPGHLSLRAIDRFDDEMLAPILSAQRERSAERIEWPRTAALLNWRLFDNPRARYDVIGAFDGGRCVGYVAARSIPCAQGGQALHMIDWIAIGDATASRDILSGLFDAAIRRARRDGCRMVQTVVHDALSQELLREQGFLVGRDGPYLVLAMHSAQPELQALAARPDAWSVTDLSMDNDGSF